MNAKSANRLLKDASYLAQVVKDAAGRMHFHADRGHVTHTLKSMHKVVDYCTRISRFLETDKRFYKRLEVAMLNCQTTSTEMKFVNAHVVFISGHFNINDLRKWLLVSDRPDTITLEVQGPGK